MQNSRNTTFSLLIFSGVLFLLGFGIKYLTNGNTKPENYARQLETALHEQEREVNDYFRKNAFLEDAIHNKLTKNVLTDLNDKAYTLCIYKGDSLLFWSNSKALPYSTEIAPTPTRVVQQVQLQKGYYELIKDRYTATGGTAYTLVGLIPIYYEYAHENDYAQNGFALDKVPRSVKIAKLGTPVHSINEQKIFHILLKGSAGRQHIPIQTLVCYLLAFFAFIWSLTLLASTVIMQYGSWVGVPFFVGSVLLTRIATTYLGFTSMFSDYDLFNPRYYAFNDMVNSLGDLFISVVLLFWIAVFMHRQLRFRHLMSLAKIPRYMTAAGVYALIFGGIFLMGFVYKSLVLDSEISLEIDNIFSLNIYSFIGLLSVTVLAVAFFFVAHKLMLLLTKLNLSTNTKLAFAGAGLVLFTIFNILNFLSATSCFLIFFTFFIIFLFELFIRRKTLSLGWLLGWVIVFSMFSSILLFQLNIQKNINSMKFYAERLSEDNDHIAEVRFANVLRKIRNDNFIKSFFINSFAIPKRQVVDRIEQLYISDYLFNHYQYNIHAYYPKGGAVRGEAPDYEGIVKKIDGSVRTSVPDVYLWNDGNSNSRYIAAIPIAKNKTDLGKLVIEFSPKAIKKSKVYPELLLDNYSKRQKKFDAFDYAIYKKGKRIAQKDKSFSASLEFDTPEDTEFYTQTKRQQNYLVYRPNADKVVVVAAKKRDLSKPVSLFSYMFCLQFAVFLIMILINRIVQALPTATYKMSISTQPSLRSRINISVISVIVLSFVAIGVVTVFYFQQEFEEYHEGRLERKVRGVLATANNDMKKHPATDGFLPDVVELSDIHNMDINLYGLNGTLLSSSQKEIFDRGLISNKIDPVAFHHLRTKGMEQHTQSETINKLEYLAAYVPLENADKKEVAYLGLPYFSRQTNLRQDVSDFMGALLNVYVLLFLIAGVVALFVGNSVTRPIVTIGEKLKEVKLGEKNEPIVWENEDEIGALVTEYNKMIGQLENSAQLLAKSNRELAWREMARQVAHEIKNPLTPMRLSIQHLQRVYQTNPDQINRLSKTILEQIDNLSHIASEFSNFAKMPQASNEYFVLDELVISVYDLFKERDNMHITLEIPDENTTVFADKKQMMRVFNNLIKNAIQAIPEDRPGNIRIAVERLDENVIVKIMDNGVGIPDEKLSSIFVPNFTTKNSGMGLGLAISRNIVQSANGSIYFETKENLGTTFFVELPIKEAVYS